MKKLISVACTLLLLLALTSQTPFAKNNPEVKIDRAQQNIELVLPESASEEMVVIDMDIEA